MKLKRILCTVLCALLLVSPVQVFASTLYVSDSQIVSCKTPVSAANTELAWDVKLGSSYKDAPSPQVVVGDTLIVMSNKKLLKLNVKNGKTVKSTDMVDMPSYSYTPPVYANGVIYCPLDNAKIQAFDYKTMKTFETKLQELVVTRAEKFAILEIIKKEKFNDFEKIRVVENYVGYKI